MRNLVCAVALLTAMSSNAAPPIQWDGAVGGSVRARVDGPVDASVVLLVSGEQRGELADCGCPARLLGGVARIEGYAQAVGQQTDAPVVRIGAGHLFDDTIGIDGTLRRDVMRRNQLMAEAVADWEVVNIGVSDVPFLDANPLASGLSAAITPTDGRPWRGVYTVATEGGTVAIVGLAGPGLAFLPPEHHSQIDPLPALGTALDGVDADVVVVVGVDLGDALVQVAGDPRVDVLVTASHTHERWPPEPLGEQPGRGDALPHGIRSRHAPLPFRILHCLPDDDASLHI